VLALLECLNTCTHSRESIVAAARAAASREDITQALVSAGCEGSEGGSDEAREAVFAEALAAYGTYEEQLAGAIEQQEQLVEAPRTAF